MVQISAPPSCFLRMEFTEKRNFQKKKFSLHLSSLVQTLKSNWATDIGKILAFDMQNVGWKMWRAQTLCGVKVKKTISTTLLSYIMCVLINKRDLKSGPTFKKKDERRK